MAYAVACPHRRCSASSTNSSGSSSSARTRVERPIAVSASSARARGARPDEGDRVGERLPAVREGSLDDRSDRRDRCDRSHALERDERGVDPRTRTKDGRRNRVEARLPCAELHENGDGAVRLGARPREEPVGNLALHHHAPVPQRRGVLERLDDERRRDVVREVGDELRGQRVEESGRRGRVRRPRRGRTFARSPSASFSTGSSERSSSIAWTWRTRSAR